MEKGLICNNITFKNGFVHFLEIDFIFLLTKHFINYWMPQVCFVSGLVISIFFFFPEWSTWSDLFDNWQLWLSGSKNTTWADSRTSLEIDPSLKQWPTGGQGDWLGDSSSLFKSEVADKVIPYMSCISIWIYANKWLMINWDLYSNTWNHLTVCKKNYVKMLSTKCVYKSYIFNIYV